MRISLAGRDSHNFAAKFEHRPGCRGGDRSMPDIFSSLHPAGPGLDQVGWNADRQFFVLAAPRAAIPRVIDVQVAGLLVNDFAAPRIQRTDGEVAVTGELFDVFGSSVE